ncbi:MAG: hypothetical protein BWY87_01379 [Deltaproteobacteria bacterium ADurb.Bin510]|nr:MAG: hypothetical protein BWY87_01379 [Deltaproteobacteria bacterium ADurb.Bin510]
MKTLQDYATEIRAEWVDVNENAALYLDDMSNFACVDCEEAVTAVARFILYARTWVGPRALVIKKELNQQIKDYRAGNPKFSYYAPRSDESLEPWNHPDKQASETKVRPSKFKK